MSCTNYIITFQVKKKKKKIEHICFVNPSILTKCSRNLDLNLIKSDNIRYCPDLNQAGMFRQ